MTAPTSSARAERVRLHRRLTRSGARFAALPVHPSRRSRGRTAGHERHVRRDEGEPGRTASRSRRMAMAGRASAGGSTAGGVVAVAWPGCCSARRSHSEPLRSHRRRAEQARRNESEPGRVASRLRPAFARSFCRARGTASHAVDAVAEGRPNPPGLVPFGTSKLPMVQKSSRPCENSVRRSVRRA